MKAFVIKQHEKTDPTVRAMREEELKSVGGGLMSRCGGGKDVTVTAGSGGGSNDGCDAE